MKLPAFYEVTAIISNDWKWRTAKFPTIGNLACRNVSRDSDEITEGFIDRCGISKNFGDIGVEQNDIGAGSVTCGIFSPDRPTEKIRAIIRAQFIVVSSCFNLRFHRPVAQPPLLFAR